MLKVYTTVIDDVVAGVRDAFLDEGVDEQVLQEMKQVWQAKLLACKAIESTTDSLDQQQPAILANSAKSLSHSKTNGTKKSKTATASASATANNQQENGKAVTPSNITTKANADLKSSNVPSLVPSGNAQQTAITQQQSVVSTATTTNSNASTTSSTSQQQQSSAPAAVVAALDPNKLVAIQITLPAQPNVANSQPRVLTIQVPASALQENQLQQVLTSPIISSIMPLPPHIASTVLQQHVNAYLQNLNMNSIPIQKQLDGACDDVPMMQYSSEDASVVAMDGANVKSTTIVERSALDRQLITALVAGQMSTLSPADAIASCSSKERVSGVGRKPRRLPLRATKQLSKSTDQEEALSIQICSSRQLDGAVDTSDEEGSDISDDNIVDDDDEDLDKEEEDDLEAEGGAEEEPLNSEDDVTDEDASDLFDTDNVVVCQYDKITRSRNKWKFYLKDGIMHIGGKDYVFQKSNGDAEW